MGVFEGIEFAKDYNKSFAEFKEEFGSTHVFKKYLPKVRERKLKDAYKEATEKSKNEVANIEKIEPDGNISTTAGESSEANASVD